MGIKNFLKRTIVPPMASTLINSIAGTLSVKVSGYEHYEYLKERGMRCIICFWHGQQFFPVYFFKNKKIAILVSMSQDGEMQNKILSSFGYEIVRGSSSHGAVSGLIGLLRKMRDGYDIGMAVDGPRGPYHVAKEGISYIAAKEDCFILPIACAFSSYKQFNAWDKFIVPYPMARGALIIGKPFRPNSLNCPMMAHRYLEKILNSMTLEAEAAVGEETPHAVEAQEPAQPENKIETIAGKEDDGR